MVHRTTDTVPVDPLPATAVRVGDEEEVPPFPWGFDEPPESGPLPPDPLGDEAFANDPDADGPWSPPGLDEAEPDVPAHVPPDVLACLPPGLLLAAELEGVDLEAVDEYHLVELVAGYHRLAAWAQSRMTDLAGRLSRRPALNPHAHLPGGEYTTNVTAEEIAPRLGLSRFAGRRIVENAAMFRLHLAGTGEALREGRIDYAKATTIVTMLKDHPGDVAWEVERLVLPDASHQTHSQLVRAINKAIIAVDPHRATSRARRARDGRRVDHPRPLPDGMASMLAVLPATDAAGLDLALEAAARTARSSGDARTIEQLRADALALLGHGALEQGFVGVAPGDAGTEPGPGPGTAGGLDDASPVAPELAPDPEAGPDPGRGAAPEVGADSAPAVRDVTSDSAPAFPEAEAEPDPAPAASPPVAADLADAPPVLNTGGSFLRTPRMPIGGIGGRRAQIQVTVPLSVLLPPEALNPNWRSPDHRCADDGEPHDVPDGTPPSPVAGLGRGCCRACSPPSEPGVGPGDGACSDSSPPSEPGVGPDDGDGARSDSAPPPDPVVGPDGCICTVSSPPPEPVPDDELPEDWYDGPWPAEVAELDGYGPITPDVAQALALSGSTWQRLVTDPLSGALLDVGRTRYRPPAAIADFVRARDQHCIRPGCSSPARVCQLDHITPWHFGGVTSADNLGTFCGRDHMTKTIGAFELERLGGGSFVWTTPSGHRYHRDRTGRVAQLRRKDSFGSRPPF